MSNIIYIYISSTYLSVCQHKNLSTQFFPQCSRFDLGLGGYTMGVLLTN